MPSRGKVNIDSLISRLLAAKSSPITPTVISEAEITNLCIQSRDVFISQPMLLKVHAPVKVCGDIHGQYKDLLRLFDLADYPPDSNFLFLGDYVDRGKQSIETICLLLAFKIKYPLNFYMLRGNHEAAEPNREYGFYNECKRRYSINLWDTFVEDCFNFLPVAAVVEGKIFCCHGGLSPHLRSMDQIKRLARPTDVPNGGLLCDLLWADPSKERGMRGWKENKGRGISYEFGEDVVNEFLDRHNFDLIVRAHEVQAEGYEFFAGSQLVTVFSAPNYTGDHWNDGAIMSVDKKLHCTFDILKV